MHFCERTRKYVKCNLLLRIPFSNLNVWILVLLPIVAYMIPYIVCVVPCIVHVTSQRKKCNRVDDGLICQISTLFGK